MRASRITKGKRWLFYLLVFTSVFTGISVSRGQPGPVNCSSYVTVTTANDRSTLDPRTRMMTSTADVTIANKTTSGITLSSPLHGVITINNATGTVTMPTALGGPTTPPYQKYYYDLSSRLTNNQLPAGASVTFTVTFVRASTVRFTYTVSSYAVLPSTNQAPVVNAGSPQTITLPESANLAGTATDDGLPAGSTLTVTWSKGSGTGTVTLGSPNAASTTATFSQAGTYVLRLTASDSLLSSSSDVTITVNPRPNQSPIANAGANQNVSIPPGQTTVNVTLDGSASTDSDGNIAAYAWTGNPTPAAVAKPTVTLTTGTYTFYLTVTDNQGATSAQSTVTVQVLQTLPPTVSVTPLTYSVNQDQKLTINVFANKADGSPVTLSARPLIANASFSASSGAPAMGIFDFVPNSSQSGVFMVSFTAQDKVGLTDTKTVQVTVNKVNHAPVISVPATAAVDEGKSLMIPLTASDPDGDTLTFSATGLPSNASIIPSTGTILFTPDYTQGRIAPYAITITARDGTLPASGTISVTVNDVPTGGTGQPGEWVLNVDPVENPSFLTTQRITGSVGGSGGTPVVPAIKSALITGMSPATGEQGQTLDVILTGDTTSYATHFASSSSKADFGAGITVNSITVTGPIQASVNVTIGGAAVVGPRSASVVTGSETAVSVVAFNVVKGKVTIRGKIINSVTGAPIAGALVTIQGSTLTAITGADGSFILYDAPSGQQVLLVNAPNHQLIQTSILAQTGLQLDLGDMKTESTVFDPSAPASVSLGSLVSRIFVDSRDKRTLEDLQKTVVDAIQFVGGKDLGVVDEYGNELNPNVTETPFFRLNHSAVETIAMHMKGDTSITLAELLWQLTQLWEWKQNNPGGQNKPNLLDWLAAIQTAVNTAWSNQNAPESRFFLMVFNNGKTISPQPPTIVPDLPLNELQASLIRLSILMMGAKATDPIEIFQQLGNDYFQTSALRPESSPLLQPILLAYNEGSTLSDRGSNLILGRLKSRPAEILVAQIGGGGGGGQQIIAKAARKQENGYIGKAITLDGRSSVVPTGVNARYQWSVVSSPSGSLCGNVCFRIDLTSSFATASQQIVFFTPDVAGEYTLQLQVSSTDGSITSDPYQIKVTVRHWPCQVSGSSDPEWSTEDKAGLTVPWENVLCTIVKDKGVEISKSVASAAGIEIPELPSSAFKGMVPKGLFGGAPNARAAADNLFMSILNTEGLHPQTVSSNAKAYEKYLPDIMNEAKKTFTPTAFQKITSTVAKEMVTGVLGYFQSQADELGKAIVYLMLDKTLEQVLNGMRPSPPYLNSVDVISADYDPNKKIALIYFYRSKDDPGPQGKKTYCENAGSSSLPADEQQKANVRCNADFFYRVWREANGQTVSLSLAKEGKDVVNGPVPTDVQSSGEPLLFVDPNPPEGQVRYYVQTRRIIGKHTVPNTNMWNEAEFFFSNYIVGSVCPPAAAQYSFAKGLLERAVDMLRAMKVQDSDFSEPMFVYVPHPYQQAAPPVSLAADGFQKNVYASISMTSSVFKLEGTNLKFAFNAGFKSPYQVGLAADSLGYLYSVNSASEAQFGGRIFRWVPNTYDREWFGAVTYYSTLLGYAHPASTQALYAGMNWGKERLFIIDMYSNSLLAIDIPPKGQLPPGDLFHNVGQPMVGPPNISPNAQSSMTIRSGGDLLMTQGSDIFRFTKPGDFGLLFTPSPFVSLTGIDADLFGNLYVADAGTRTITALPADKLPNPSFPQQLAGDPAVRSLYTIVSNILYPGEVRVGGSGTALVWFDFNGYQTRPFGLSARLVDGNGQPLSFATVSNTLDPSLSTVADEDGVFHMPGLLSPTATPNGVSLVITDTLKRTGTYKVTSLARVGETFIDPIVFTPDVVPLPSSHIPNTPPNPPVIKEVSVTLTGGSTTIIPTNDLQSGGLPPVVPPDDIPNVTVLRAPKVDLVAPVNRLTTNLGTVQVMGVVSDPAITEVQVLVNGTVIPMVVTARQFSGLVNLQDGINSIEAKATLSLNGQTATGTSGVVLVQKVDGPVAMGALSGVVLDQATGYPVTDVRVIIKNTGLYTYTDSLGVWFISDVPNGTFDVQIVP